jgi:phage terminase Nu1 subunit (DNA packaging protein)
VASEYLTISAYARLRGVSRGAVQQRIAAGALPTSAKKIKGQWVILDAEQANAEWAQHTRAWVAPGNGVRGPAPSALAEATLRERKARAWAMELEIARKTRELVPAREVDLRWSAMIVAARTAMLGIPSRARGRLPHLTAGDMLVLEGLIREALTELSAMPAATGVQAS